MVIRLMGMLFMMSAMVYAMYITLMMIIFGDEVGFINKLDAVLEGAAMQGYSWVSIAFLLIANVFFSYFMISEIKKSEGFRLKLTVGMFVATELMLVFALLKI